MYRRRARRPREVAFGLDSFLDLVANVVGIIIRLILVAWVGARAYQALRSAPDAEVPGRSLPALPALSDPLEPEVACTRQELDAARRELPRVQQQAAAARRDTEALAAQLNKLVAEGDKLDEEQRAAEDGATRQGGAAAAAAQSLDELRRRRQKLEEEMIALEKLPSARKALHYRTPVSRPVSAEELHFECQGGRVAFVDVAAFVAEIKQSAREKGEALRRQWSVEEVTAPVGDFRLRYVLERERGHLDGLAGGGPTEESNFRYGLSGWTVEPLNPGRGESAEAALAPGSAFRGIADGLDPDHAVVTFWVTADSFALYRRLRDYLYERGVEVAGRPLPPGHPIRSSRDGTRSRGQ